MPGFKSEAAKFKPVHSADVCKAVAHQLSADGKFGHFGLQGSSEHSIAQILGMVEAAAGKGSTPASNALVNSFVSLFDDFFTGNTHDGNFDAMMNHYAENGCSSDLQCFWQASGLSADGNIAEFFQANSMNTATLAEPPMSAYKSVSLD